MSRAVFSYLEPSARPCSSCEYPLMPYREAEVPVQLVFTTFNGVLRAIDVTSGEVAWERVLPDVTTAASLLANGKQLYVYSGNVLTACDAETGAVRWKAMLTPSLNALARIEMLGDTVLVAAVHILHAVSAVDGHVRWKVRVGQWTVEK